MFVDQSFRLGERLPRQLGLGGKVTLIVYQMEGAGSFDFVVSFVFDKEWSTYYPAYLYLFTQLSYLLSSQNLNFMVILKYYL